VDFTFSPEQEDMRVTVRAFLAKFTADGQVRAMVEDPRGFTDAWWDEVTDLGWPGLLVPERLGGSGLGMVDLTVVQEECGRLPLPGPFFSSAVCATLAVLRLGEDDLGRRLAAGRVRGTLALEEGGSGDPLDAVGVVARPDGAGSGAAGPEAATWRLEGVKPLVLDGHTADLAIVAARDPDGLAAFLVEDPAGTAVPALDVTRKMARLELDGRPARRLGPAGDQSALLARVRDDIDVALCAETVGAAERALELAIDYSKARVQFDRPIATFQAIKHKIVDMLHQLELARVGTHYAAWASDAEDVERKRAAAMCKGFVGEASAMVTGESIQVHGGVGFTWDVDCHLLFRRVKQDDVLFGRQGWQRARLADLVLT